MIGKRLAKAMKGMPSEEEMTAFRTWKEGQAGEKERWDKLTGERDTLAGRLTAAEAERDQLKRDLYLAQKGPDRRGGGVYRFQGREDGER